jgi:large subunit ribosomal protein L6
MPYSKFKANIAEILKREGYITDFDRQGSQGVGKTLEVTLKYGPTVSVPFRAQAASASPACVVTPSPTHCRCRARWPRHRHHLDEPGSADSPECLDRRASAAKSSPTSGERGELNMSSHWQAPDHRPAGVDVKIDGQNFDRQGPQGFTTPTRGSEPITAGRRQRDRLDQAPDDLRPTRAAARPDPHDHGLMVKGVHRGLREEARDRRHRLPRHSQGPQGIEFSLGYSHTITVQPARRHHPRTVEPNQVIVKGIDKQARRPGCRQHPQAAQARSRTRARASSTPASTSAARLERLVSDMSVR